MPRPETFNLDFLSSDECFSYRTENYSDDRSCFAVGVTEIMQRLYEFVFEALAGFGPTFSGIVLFLSQASLLWRQSIVASESIFA
jgi:hypothetical protein